MTARQPPKPSSHMIRSSSSRPSRSATSCSALWAAEQMGISGADAEAYAKQVVIADFEEPGDADVLRRMLGDLTGKGIAMDEHKVCHEMTRLLEEAKTQVSTE